MTIKIRDNDCNDPGFAADFCDGIQLWRELFKNRGTDKHLSNFAIHVTFVVGVALDNRISGQN